MVKRTSDQILLAMWTMIRPWQKFALSEYLKYDDCLWIFGGEGVSSDGYLNEYGDIIFSI